MTFIKSKYYWLVIALFSAFCVFLAHNVFQNTFYMLPCENCVYIRYFFFVIILGTALAFLVPKYLGALGYISVIYGGIYGILVALRLHKIRVSLETGDAFGVSGCKMTPSFHFGLPLDKWWDEMFAPKVLCGFDAPMPPENADISAFAQYFIELYKDGWFLVPKYQFLDMAQCCIIAFATLLALVLLRAIFKGWEIRIGRK